MTDNVLQGRVAVMATMHGKEAAFGPPLVKQLGLSLVLPHQIDTDALGTFTGEVARAGTIEEAACKKAALGMDISGCDLGLASEGSYGPHPHLPLIPAGFEVAALLDRRTGQIVIEKMADEAPTYDHITLAPGEDARPFLERIGFPAQRVIIKAGAGDSGPCVAKGIGDFEDFETSRYAAQRAACDGLVFVQTDMRACFNPRRMDVLGMLAQKLTTRLATPCPTCAAPGFGFLHVERGLPCKWCAGPTLLARSEIWGCTLCHTSEERGRGDGQTEADPGSCPRCNP